MPTISKTGKKRFIPEAVISEDNFTSFEVRSFKKKKWLKRFEVHGFIVTESEFDKLRSYICCDGMYEIFSIRYEKREKIKLGGGSSDEPWSQEDLEEVKRGEFVVGNEKGMIQKLHGFDIPIRRWNILLISILRLMRVITSYKKGIERKIVIDA